MRDPFKDFYDKKARVHWDQLKAAYGLSESHYNSFVHAWTSAVFANVYGYWFAVQFGDAREILSWSTYQNRPAGRRDVFKDVANNRTGAVVGSWFKNTGTSIGTDGRNLAIAVLQRMQNGDIIFNTSDPRAWDMGPNLSDTFLRADALFGRGRGHDASQPYSGPSGFQQMGAGDSIYSNPELLLETVYQNTPINENWLVSEKDRLAAAALLEDMLSRGMSVNQAGVLGNIIGSTIGRYLGGSNVGASVLASATLSTIGQSLAQGIVGIGVYKPYLNASQVIDGVLDDFGSQFLGNLKSAAIGSVSSLLSLELGRALGIDGFGAELLSTTSSSVIGHVLNNVANGNHIFAGISEGGLFKTVEGVTPQGGILSGAIGSFLGAKLGSLILAPTNTEGAILSSIGSAAGAWALGSTGALAGFGTSLIGSISATIGGKIGQALGNVIVPGIGALVGFILGSLIGRLFGKKKPRLPTASADTVLNLASGEWSLGNVTSANGGNATLVREMALNAVGTINGIVRAVVGASQAIAVGNTISLSQRYGHSGSTLYLDMNSSGSWQRIYSGTAPEEAVDIGVIQGLRGTKLIGGDLLMKRAILSAQSADVLSLIGNLQIAEDYSLYLTAPTAINQMIVANPTSEFSVAWAITLQRAEELGLNQFQASDFYGGLAGFAKSFGFRSHIVEESAVSRFENISVSIEGSAVRIQATDGSAPFSILNGSNNIVDPVLAARSALIPDANRVGYNLWTGEASAGNDIWVASAGGPVTMDDSGTQWVSYWDPYWGYYQYPVTVTGGDDIFVGSSYGDTLYGRSGWDWLDGGAGHDLIYGGENDDVLLGGAGVDQMFGEGGDDYLAGGDDNDYVQSWIGGPAPGGLYGGDGNDTLVGNGGRDALFGENGNDLFLVDQDGGGLWDYYDGGSGSDTASFERFNAGIFFDLTDNRGNGYTAQTYGDGFASIENITGSQYNDSIFGDEASNVLKGLGGNDTLYGRDGDDILEGGAGADILNGGNGVDTVSYENASHAVSVNLATGEILTSEAGNDVLVSIENIRGSTHGDTLVGNAADNHLIGLAGDDFFRLSGGSDIIDGGVGFDTLDASGAGSPLTLYYDAGWYDPYWGIDYPGAGWIASVPNLGATTFSNIEGFVGTAYADSLSGSAGDEVFEGGAGNDVLYGSTGSDTYVFGRGDGSDSISETSDGTNTIILKEGIDWRDVSIAGAAYYQQSGTLVVSILGTSDQIVAGYNFSYVNGGANAGNHNHAIKSLSLAGVSTIDIDLIDYTPWAADNNATVVYGGQNLADLIFAYGGDDTIYAAGNGTAYESRGNVIYAGDGNDTIYASFGDDQYIFERGNGVDTLTDAGGLDTIVMGPSVAAEDVIYEVVVTNPGSGGYGGTADLYIGLRDPNNSALTASQVADRIRVVGGGTKEIGVILGLERTYTTEYVRVGGQEIDLLKADINWQTSYYYDGSWYWPVALDLDGDGIELRSVHGSRIASVEADGTITRMGWLGQDDGFLALDRNGDGAIDRIGEISFIGDVEGAKSDLEGLAAYDSNGDGKLDASDKRFADFKVWQDKNQDGFGSADELVSLDEAGLRSISLKGQSTGFSQEDGLDNVVLATSEIEWADPKRAGAAHDVALARLQIRTDGGDDTAKGRDKDPLDAMLYGVQGLTEEQVELIREAKAVAKKDGDAGLIYRIESLIEAGATIKNALYTIDRDAKAGLSIAARRGDASDRFAESEWTRAGSVIKGAPDHRGQDAAFQKFALSDEQKAVIEEARIKVAADKATAAAVLAELATRDADSSEMRPAVVPPTPEEMARLKASDKFRLLNSDTDHETAARLKAELGESDQARKVNPQPFAQRVDHEGVESIEAQQSAADEGVQRIAPVEASLNHSRGTAYVADLLNGSDRSESVVSDYGVVITTANARLVQALANFGDAVTMMTSFQGLNSTNSSEAAWLTVDAMPSIERMASIR